LICTRRHDDDDGGAGERAEFAIKGAGGRSRTLRRLVLAGIMLPVAIEQIHFIPRKTVIRGVHPPTDHWPRRIRSSLAAPRTQLAPRALAYLIVGLCGGTRYRIMKR